MTVQAVNSKSENPWAKYVMPIKPVEGGNSPSSVAGFLAHNNDNNPALKMPTQPPVPAGCNDVCMA